MSCKCYGAMCEQNDSLGRQRRITCEQNWTSSRQARACPKLDVLSVEVE
jgi:hypothetical protein